MNVFLVQRKIKTEWQINKHLLSRVKESQYNEITRVHEITEPKFR
jgi:hypothetical protein